MAFKIAPSILSADFANLERDILRVAKAGADWLHVDVMDGHFVSNLTIGPPVVKALHRVSPLPLDVHLMIENPEKYIEAFIQAGARYLTIHVESAQNPRACLELIRSRRVGAGITLRPGTAVEKILPFLDVCDLVLVMTVEPGFGGQSFMMDQVAKIQRLRKEVRGYQHPILIEVDGGINDQTARHCLDADVLVAGNFIFGSDPEGAIQRLKQI